MILQTPASGSADPMCGYADPDVQFYTSQQAGLQIQCVGLALASWHGSLNPMCLQLGAQPHPLQSMEFSVTGYSSPNINCP